MSLQKHFSFFLISSVSAGREGRFWLLNLNEIKLFFFFLANENCRVQSRQNIVEWNSFSFLCVAFITVADSFCLVTMTMQVVNHEQQHTSFDHIFLQGLI